VEQELKFQAPTPTLKCLTPAPERFGPLQSKRHCIIYTTRLPNKLRLWNRNPNFRLRPSIIAWAQAPHYWLQQTHGLIVT